MDMTWLDHATEEARERIEELRAVYGDLYVRLLELLYRHDPGGITQPPGAPPDEYNPELLRIYPHLLAATSRAEVERLVEEEFGPLYMMRYGREVLAHEELDEEKK
jgi:hypothetical protein